MVVFISTFTVF